MNIINFVKLYWSDILLILCGLSAIIFAICKKDFKFIKSIVFQLVTEAEIKYGDGTGILKLTETIKKLYKELPPVIKLVITEKQLVKLIEKGLAEAKKKWEANKNLLKGKGEN